MTCILGGRVLAVAFGLALLLAPAMGFADESRAILTVHGDLKADVIAYDAGDGRRGTAELDLLSVIAEANLARVAPGLMAHLHVQNTSGGEPNAIIGAVRGFDNNEVVRQRLRLYEVWVQKSFGDDAASVLVGFYDFNSEFNVTDASGLFIGPSYGISTEIAGTGEAGPSIFPSTGLALRGRVRVGEGGYVQAVAINPDVGVVGDPGGPDFKFDKGAFLAGEAGFRSEAAHLSVGVWRYTDAPENSRSSSPQDHAQGGYVLGEHRLGSEGSPATAFLRIGASDGRTGDFALGLQTGVTVSPAFSTRPDSAFGVGLDYDEFSAPYRRGLRDEGIRATRGETGLEITYADRISEHVLIQPDLQFIFDVGGDADREIATVGTLRLTVEF